MKSAVALPWVLLIIVAGTLGCLAALGYIHWPGSDDTSDGKAQQLQRLAERNADFGRYMDEARAKTKWNTSAGLMKDLFDELPQWQRRAQALSDQLSAIEAEKHPAALQIAGDPQLLRQFLALKERKRPSTAEWERMRASLVEIREVCDKAVADRSVIVDLDPRFEETLKQVVEPVIVTCEQLKVDEGSLASLIQQAAGKPPARQSFQAALASHVQQRDLDFLKSLADDSDAQRRARLRVARDKELAAERAMLDAENKLRSAAADAKTARAQAIVKEAQKKLAAEKTSVKRN